MSHLTECNRCTLRRMQRAAEARGATVIVTKVTVGDMAGWTHAHYSDRPGDVSGSYFQELTEECACDARPNQD